MERYLLAVIFGIGFGLASRYLMLRSDYRQYPAYPHGYVTHLSLGLIASVLGALLTGTAGKNLRQSPFFLWRQRSSGIFGKWSARPRPTWT